MIFYLFNQIKIIIPNSILHLENNIYSNVNNIIIPKHTIFRKKKLEKRFE